MINTQIMNKIKHRRAREDIARIKVKRKIKMKKQEVLG